MTDDTDDKMSLSEGGVGTGSALKRNLQSEVEALPSAVSASVKRNDIAWQKYVNRENENSGSVYYSPMNKDDETFDFLAIRRHVSAKVKDLIPGVKHKLLRLLYQIYQRRRAVRSGKTDSNRAEKYALNEVRG